MDFGHGGSRLGATIGFGFLQSGSLALQPGAAADLLPVMSRLRRNAPLSATPSQRTAVFSHPQFIEEDVPRQRLLPAR